jgi:glycosyltransferase involved in cell wall biosynthesis
MFGNKKISVVVPAHNEALIIVRAVRAIPDYVDHVIVVDDASCDGTLEALHRGVRRPGLQCIRHRENLGVGGAIVSGYRRALEIGADVVAVMAGDAQMDPEDLPQLLAPAVTGRADYVKGDRLSWPGVTKEMPLLRYIGNHLFSLLTRLSSGYRHVRDSQCGYTAVTAETLERVDLDALYHRYGFPNDMLAKLHTVGARLSNVAVRPIYGQEVSGISLATALFRVPLVLLRAYIWRNKTERALTARVEMPSLKGADG